LAALALLVPLAPAPAVAVPASGPLPVARAGPAAAHYVRLRLLTPADGQTIHDNTGRVTVRVDLQPPLRATAGHRFRVRLDGSMLAGAWRAGPFVLEGVPRGRHNLRALVVDAEGRPLIESRRVVFQMWHASRLMPGRGTPR
jgi:hypothetical protein